MCQVRRPGALDNIPGSSTINDDLVGKPARLSENFNVQRISEVVTIHNRDGQGVGAGESHGSARLGREEFGDDAEGVLVVYGELVELLGPAVAFRGEELDVGLAGFQAHGVATFFTGCRVPEVRVGEAVVQTGKGENAEGEAGEETFGLLLPEGIGLGKGIAVVDEVIVSEAGLLGLVEHEDDLQELVGLCLITATISRVTYQVVHEVLTHAGKIDKSGDTVLLQLILGTNSGPVEDVGTAVSTTADDDLLADLDLDDAAVGLDSSNTSGLELAVLILLDDDLVHVSLNQEVDVALLGLGDKVSSSGAQTLVHGSGSMAAAVGILAMREHVVV